MKQHITAEQWEELNQVGKMAITEWWAFNRDCDSRLLSIGQMIEFLDNVDIDVRLNKGRQRSLGYINGNRKEKELCDALWEAVKEVLEVDLTNQK